MAHLLEHVRAHAQNRPGVYRYVFEQTFHHGERVMLTKILAGVLAVGGLTGVAIAYWGAPALGVNPYGSSRLKY